MITTSFRQSFWRLVRCVLAFCSSGWGSGLVKNRAQPSRQGRHWDRKIPFWGYGWHIPICFLCLLWDRRRTSFGRIFLIVGNSGDKAKKTILPLSDCSAQILPSFCNIGSFCIPSPPCCRLFGVSCLFAETKHLRYLCAAKSIMMISCRERFLLCKSKSLLLQKCRRLERLCAYSSHWSNIRRCR